MKLAEALIFRVDCQKKIAQLRSRLVNAAKVQEGEEPPENPQILLADLDSNVNELTHLIQKINQTNSQTILEGNLTISDALAKRDTLAIRRDVYDALLQSAASRQDRYSLTEIKSVSTVNIAEIQQTIDRMARDYRELDTKIQQANWNTELLD